MNTDEARDITENYPLAETTATRMLARGIERHQAKTGETQREVAERLGYKTSVVLSHMATGRVPIPIDRAPQIADLLRLDPAAFVTAVLKQRHPEIDFESLIGRPFPSAQGLVAELQAIAGVPLDALPRETKDVLREVVASNDPRARWVSDDEWPKFEILREGRPRK